MAIPFFSFSLLKGYALYDMVVMYKHGGEALGTWLHHVVLAYGCFLMLGFRQAAFFPLVFTISELTVVPNNLLWIAQKLGTQSRSTVDALVYWRVRPVHIRSARPMLTRSRTARVLPAFPHVCRAVLRVLWRVAWQRCREHQKDASGRRGRIGCQHWHHRRAQHHVDADHAAQHAQARHGKNARSTHTQPLDFSHFVCCFFFVCPTSMRNSTNWFVLCHFFLICCSRGGGRRLHRLVVVLLLLLVLVMVLCAVVLWR